MGKLTQKDTPDIGKGKNIIFLVIKWFTNHGFVKK